jgi:hypothetical protein
MGNKALKLMGNKTLKLMDNKALKLMGNKTLKRMGNKTPISFYFHCWTSTVNSQILVLYNLGKHFEKLISCLHK